MGEIEDFNPSGVSSTGAVSQMERKLAASHLQVPSVREVCMNSRTNGTRLPFFPAIPGRRFIRFCALSSAYSARQGVSFSTNDRDALRCFRPRADKLSRGAELHLCTVTTSLNAVHYVPGHP